MQFSFDLMGGQGWAQHAGARADRYFFALLPDAETEFHIDSLAHDLRRRLRLNGAPLGAGKYHVTLWGMQSRDGPQSQDVAMMQQVADRVGYAAFAVGFDQAASFGRADSPALVLIATDALPAADRLHAALREGMRRAGVKAARQSFRPHLTLLYDRTRLPALDVPPLRWMAREFVLVWSRDRQSYDILARWPL